MIVIDILRELGPLVLVAVLVIIGHDVRRRVDVVENQILVLARVLRVQYGDLPVNEDAEDERK